MAPQRGRNHQQSTQLRMNNQLCKLLVSLSKLFLTVHISNLIGWGCSQIHLHTISPQPDLRMPVLLQKATDNADPPVKGTSACACSHTEHQLCSNELIWSHEPASGLRNDSSLTQSNGVGEVNRDSERQERVWGAKAASWRKWSMS